MVRFPVRRYLALLSVYLRPQGPKIFALTCILLVDIGLQLSSPKIIEYFINTFVAGGDTMTLLFAGCAYIVIALLTQGVAVLSTYLSGTIAWTATNRLRTDLVRHCLALDLSFHKTRSSGELIERIDGDVDALSNFFSQFFVELLINLLLLAGILGIFFTIYWLLGIVMVAFSATMLVVITLIRRRVLPLWKENRQQSALFFGFLSEHISGSEDLRGNGAVPYVMLRFYQIIRAWFPIQRRTLIMTNNLDVTVLFLFVCGTSLSLFIGVYLWSMKLIAVGTIYAIFRYTDLLSQPLDTIQMHMQDLQQAEACIQRIEGLLQTRTLLSDGQGTPLPEGTLAIDFEQVSFGYTPGQKVLHDISFHMEPGRVVGLLGRTGSGKTTLARLLARLYDPQEGSICLGGVSLREPYLRDLRRHVGFVTQDVQLFHASVRDNLTFFDRALSDTYILAQIEQVGLKSWYDSLSTGLDTIIGQDGSGLSAGEAQLLALTRIFLHKPGLIILDEASARLDPATERLMERALNHLLSGRSALIIAHRLSTVQRADEILILEQGRIVEHGKRTELAHDPDSRFAQLLHLGLEEALA
ncbi:ABC transporter ATP-binding protein [Ktedonobacter robiniae]|uniref:Helicase n=1 Tax=Ktedonobacter robiniae TaxID=2778365 RepID=A0ABQ3V2J2_9CHLR|nr:ABC transporter ATP-binding protein [Ktedonobacter robiniae]GHO58850.1 helicase [Ktedonobacter robiniae]